MIKTILIDDEQHALELLESFSRQCSLLDIIATFNCSVAALEFINSNPVDLIISDIDMPKINGLELNKVLTKNIATIFITAHHDFALESYDLDIIDYLLKPVMLPRFIKAVNKANRRINSVQNPKQAGAQEDYLFVKDGYSKKRVNFADIEYIEAQGDYLLIQQTNDKLLVLFKLTEFIKLLPQNQFVRIHRSTIVNLSKVDVVEKDHVVVHNTDLSIGKTYRNEFLSRLD